MCFFFFRVLANKRELAGNGLTPMKSKQSQGQVLSRSGEKFSNRAFTNATLLLPCAAFLKEGKLEVKVLPVGKFYTAPSRSSVHF